MWINFILSGNNLTKGADKMKLPRHIGIIPDGNRRWARSQNLRKNGQMKLKMSLKSQTTTITTTTHLGKCHLNEKKWGF